MMVLVDTPVWSLALRRRPEHLSESQQSLVNVLSELIREGRAQMLGPIRQELLSGIREEAQLKRIRDYLRAFREPPLEAEDYEDAARASNQCRNRGIAGSPSIF
jgi:predicted nucleic acid-binding protein